MMTAPRWLVALVLPLTLAACEQTRYAPRYDPNTAGGSAEYASVSNLLTFATDAPSYEPGAPVVVRITNGSSLRLGYNLCRASLQRYMDDDWRDVQPTLGEACTAESRTLGPGQNAAFSFRTDRQMRRGQYRVRSELTDTRSGTPISAYSKAFRLESNQSD